MRLFLPYSIVITPALVCVTRLLYMLLQCALSHPTLLFFPLFFTSCFSSPLTWSFHSIPRTAAFHHRKHKRTFPLNNESPHVGLACYIARDGHVFFPKLPLYPPILYKSCIHLFLVHECRLIVVYLLYKIFLCCTFGQVTLGKEIFNLIEDYLIK